MTTATINRLRKGDRFWHDAMAGFATPNMPCEVTAVRRGVCYFTALDDDQRPIYQYPADRMAEIIR